ncbi:hypothetical protein VTL71DRAFT_4788 [Oculimacula yallundae]|uniref:Uncharacterized protein n=1 Tax=Oculimacula yallundae TaxID=86028 RepID=A0ABR4C4Q1_9HELO
MFEVIDHIKGRSFSLGRTQDVKVSRYLTRLRQALRCFLEISSLKHEIVGVTTGDGQLVSKRCIDNLGCCSSVT